MSNLASPKQIRNFSIIAHIDHGKTTLTDQFLKLTKTVAEIDLRERMMDSNPIEQERGVTIKLAPVRMEHKGYILNLIDTPGHVDFGYEVNRSLQACEGAILLVDASQGIQAQTLANYEKAKKLGLTIIPVVNKIDLDSAEIVSTIIEMIDTFEVKEEEILLCSAKTGKGIQQILDTIIEKIPAPKGSTSANLQAMIITSKYDNHRGAIAYVRVINGQLKKSDSLYLKYSETSFQPNEIGVFVPQAKKVDCLTAGEVGYIGTGLKEIELLKIGDTITLQQQKNKTSVLPGFKEPTPMVFMELYPLDNHRFQDLKDATEKLKLHDASIQFSATHSQALGNGLRVGFLGIFHAEVVRERLAREFNLELIATAPSVKYKVLTKNNQKIIIESPADLPDPSQIQGIQEPITKATIFAPVEYLPHIVEFARRRRGQLINSINNGTRARLEYRLPLSELIVNFHDKLKSLSSGYASLEYEVIAYRPVNAVKVDILVNKEIVEALSFITIKENAESKGRELVEKLKEVVPRQLFQIPIQAAIGGKIIARADVKAYRKDVTAKLYGGDRTRRMKLLKKQSEGKKRMKKFGEVELNQDAFLAVLKTD
ncbi:MAG: translation elongation factor 4 [Patescibacteria group bacterium]|nr:translation elongation factor 4 [Patescibacteria group bacterium]